MRQQNDSSTCLFCLLRGRYFNSANTLAFFYKFHRLIKRTSLYCEVEGSLIISMRSSPELLQRVFNSFPAKKMFSSVKLKGRKIYKARSIQYMDATIINNNLYELPSFAQGDLDQSLRDCTKGWCILRLTFNALHFMKSTIKKAQTALSRLMRKLVFYNMLL